MKYRVLVVEAAKDVSNELVRIMELSGYEVMRAFNGHEGYILAQEHLPDLIISNIVIPGINGFELLKKLQMNEDTAAIPLIFLSSESNPSDVREAMNLGADDFITIPYEIDELVNSIKIRLEKKSKRESQMNLKIENLQDSVRRTIPHEFRTPLNVILGFSEFLMKSNKNIHQGEALEMINNINESGHNLLKTFENYILYTNLELISASRPEKLKYQNYKTYLTDIFVKDVASSKANEYDRQTDLNLNLTDVTVDIYEDHLRKIIDELLANSFELSEKGTEVKIVTTLVENNFNIVITDFGSGENRKLFLNQSEADKFGSKLEDKQLAGLGLNIVKKIVGIYNGSISINKQQDSITEISIKLPANKAD